MGLKDEKRSIFGHTKRKQCGVKEEREKRFTILLFNRRKSEERKKTERESSVCVFFQKDIQLHGPSPDVLRRLLLLFFFFLAE